MFVSGDFSINRKDHKGHINLEYGTTEGNLASTRPIPLQNDCEYHVCNQV
ncbi:MAG: hypothetical protein RL234_1445 [Pseudomonadota bacterium]